MRDLGGRFQRFWAASTVSALGDGLLVVALPLLAKRANSSPAVIAGVYACGRLPWVFALPIGSIVDRRDARKVLIVMDLVRAVALFGLGGWLLLGSHAPNAFAVAALAVVLSTCAVAFYAGVQRVIPRLVSEPDLARANGLLESASLTGDQLLGPAIGGVFAAHLSIPLVADGLSFAGSAFVLSGMPSVPPTPKLGSSADEIRRGWNWFRQHQAFRGLTFATAVVATFSTFVVATEVVIVTETLGLRDFWLGPLTAVIAAGAILGSLAAARIIGRLGTNIIPISAFLSGLLYLGASGSRSAAVVFPFLAAQSALISVNNVSTASIRQRTAPAELRGRVIALSRSIIYGVQVPGALIGGWIAKKYGTDTMLVVAGVALIVFSLATARPLRRILETLPQPGSAMAK